MNMAVPKEIVDAPELRLGLDLFLQAWLDLNSCRSVGMGVGLISWLAREDYAVRCGFDEDQREALHHHIPKMDAVYLEHLDRQRESSRG